MNKLFYGDNLDVLRKFIRDETVDLCYIDPPFNSKRNYNQIYNNIGQEDQAQAQAFVDTWTWDDHANECLDEILTNKNGVQTAQSIALINGLQQVLSKGSLFAYLVSMTVRIAEIHRVLKYTGSFYLHCDPTASHYLKLVCDTIFVTQGGDYKNEISWQRTNAHNTADRYGRNHDILFFYTKGDKYTWNKPMIEYSPEQLKRYKVDPDGRLFTCQDLTASRENSDSGKFEWRGTMPSSTRGWGYKLEQLEEWWDEGRIMAKKDGTPRMDGLIVYLEDMKGKPVQSMWTDIDRIANTSPERLGYPTQKPEALLERVIEASSNEGDLVLDVFCGCGTTVAVANRLKRKWIGMDITYQSVSLILKRLKDSEGQEAVDNVELHGVPKDMESVDALVHKKDDRVRKEFEKWAILTYSDNRAVINEKKGADQGIDGIAYTRKSKKEILPVILSVKSGKNVNVKDVRDLFAVVKSENAACGIFITRHEPTQPMLDFAKKQGQFKPEHFTGFDKIQIVTVQEILDGERMNLPLMEEVTKKAKKAINEVNRSLFDN